LFTRKNFAFLAAAGLIVAGMLFTRVPVDADASSSPVNPGERVGPLREVPLVVVPQAQEPDPYYYKFGPYVFPPVLRVEQPMVDVEQATPPASSATPMEQRQYWYYCQDSKTYYAYVQTCATPWQRVTPRPSQ
jgi:hypothetical protein